MNMHGSFTDNKNNADVGKHSGSFVERMLFNNRVWVVVFCAIVTVFAGWQLSGLGVNTSFEKMVPKNHPYIQNFIKYKEELTGLGNAVRISVENPSGQIYDAHYLEVLRNISDEVFMIPGVDRTQLKSIWTPSTRWIAVTADGFEGGAVIPADYDGSPASLETLKENIARSGELGLLVAKNGRSSVIYAPLLGVNQDGSPINYGEFSKRLEQIRDKYSSQGVKIHITGFAKLIGDLIEGLRSVLAFFAISVIIAIFVVFYYTRCVRSTSLVVCASLLAVVWQLGLFTLFGFSLDPYSILVPFLIFAIGISHGAQKMNGIMQDIGRGADKLHAARLTFRRLFLAGLTALLADAVGFAVLLLIDIQVIRELAIAASLGVLVLIVTNLILLPILLSYIGVSSKAAKRSLSEEESPAGQARHPLWRFLDKFTQRRWAIGALVIAIGLAGFGHLESKKLQIGDLDAGAPELQPNSRYNQDVQFMNVNYGASSDVLAIMVSTPDGKCTDYSVLNKVDALEWQLKHIPGVDATNSMALQSRRVMAAMNEGSLKWFDFVANQEMLNFVTTRSPRGIINDACNLLTIYAFLHDHKADTLQRVVTHVEAFAAQENTNDVKFLLAAGTSGIEAATNVVVSQAWRQMLYLVYGAVTLLCFITFRSWRAVVVAILPLILTSILAEALMVRLNMGVKVATLPVIALGVGIGVDYALYILSVTLAQLRMGRTLSDAYYEALKFTGKVVILTGITLAMGVLCWSFSPIKFQADMGILLGFMFLLNMIGALVLIPSLSHFLLKPSPTNNISAP